MSKYELVDYDIILGLYRLRCLTSIPSIGVNEGDLGGRVSGESNLSQEGTCWIHPGALSVDDSRVTGNAQIYDTASVMGRASISGNSSLHANAHAGESAIVNGYARVYGVITANAIASEYAIIEHSQVLRSNMTLTGKLRCFTGLPGQDVIVADHLVAIGSNVYTPDAWLLYMDDILRYGEEDLKVYRALLRTINELLK